MQPAQQKLEYALVAAACLAAGLAAGWSALGVQVDNDVQDFLARIRPVEERAPESLLLGIDEKTYAAMGGLGGLRRTLAATLERIAGAGPKVVVTDLILAGAASDPEQDARLEAALANVSPVVLASNLTAGGWEEPYAGFARRAAAIGHVHADPDALDNVVRRVPLEKAHATKRRWAMALEAYRLARGVSIEESPDKLRVGSLDVPLARSDSRSMLIRFSPRAADQQFTIPHIPIQDFLERPELARQVAGKVVFIGFTAQGQDRHMTPQSFGQATPGVEIHANAYETLARGEFLRPASESAALAFCLLLAAAAGAAFCWRFGWQAYALGAAVVAAAHLAPYAGFAGGLVFPYTAPAATAWLAVSGAATWQHFVVRRRLLRSEAEGARYQKAIQFVTHEMRSPLTAIQGSSELMGRYNLSEEKRHQIAEMINAESKRLARMIQTFLDVERLSAGEMDVRREPFPLDEVMAACLTRVKPLAERKQIVVEGGAIPPETVVGDRELMEYACYNLLTNAIKYSPSGTTVTVAGRREGEQLRLSVSDQGIGMDDKELRQIFRKFYRTNKAEASGEAGTGIGLSIVEQIVTLHGGKIEVTSTPGQGSCFTIVLPVAVAAGARTP